MIRLGLGLRRSASFLWIRLASAWEKQNRAFWENISVNWENWTSVVGTFVYYEENTNNWSTYTTNWEDFK